MSEHVEVKVVNTAGNVVFGPTHVDMHMPLSSLKDALAQSSPEHAWDGMHSFIPADVQMLLGCDVLDGDATLGSLPCDSEGRLLLTSIITCLQTSCYLHMWTDNEAGWHCEEGTCCPQITTVEVHSMEEFPMRAAWELTEGAALRRRHGLIDLLMFTSMNFTPHRTFKVKKNHFPVMRIRSGHAVAFMSLKLGNGELTEWLWYTGLDDTSFAACWRSVHSVKDFFDRLEDVPGTLVPAWNNGYLRSGLWTLRPDTLQWDVPYQVLGSGGVQVYVPWGAVWFAEIGDENCSRLISPIGENFFHAGAPSGNAGK